jgi:hypothetical protein
MTEPERITAEEVYGKLKDGSARLFCTYDDEDKFGTVHLEGAISFNTFISRLPSLSNDQETVFYRA